MKFTNRSRNNTATSIDRPPLYNMMFRNRTTLTLTTATNQTTSPAIKPSDGNRMTWGAPTWTLLHMIPEKINYDNFVKNKDSIIRLIVTICSNLPCPTCSQHANEYMKKVNFIAIKTPEDLKKMLFVFHNSVNQQKGYAQYSYDDMNKYVDLDYTTVLNEFMSHYQKKIYAPNLIAQQMYRQKQVEVVKTWFRENLHLFQ
jgi:hypothetical protein